MPVSVLRDGESPLIESDEQLLEFLADESYIHFVAMGIRSGVDECLTLLEHSEYPPNTERNDLFHLRVFEWEEIPWYLASIPANEIPFMEYAASQSGLRVTKNTMGILAIGGFREFPIRNERTYMLINAERHPAHKGDPKTNQTLFEEERASIEEIRAHFTGQ